MRSRSMPKPREGVNLAEQLCHGRLRPCSGRVGRLPEHGRRRPWHTTQAFRGTVQRRRPDAVSQIEVDSLVPCHARPRPVAVAWCSGRLPCRAGSVMVTKRRQSSVPCFYYVRFELEGSPMSRQRSQTAFARARTHARRGEQPGPGVWRRRRRADLLRARRRGVSVRPRRQPLHRLRRLVGPDDPRPRPSGR